MEITQRAKQKKSDEEKKANDQKIREPVQEVQFLNNKRQGCMEGGYHQRHNSMFFPELRDMTIQNIKTIKRYCKFEDTSDTKKFLQASR